MIFKYTLCYQLNILYCKFYTHKLYYQLTTMINTPCLHISANANPMPNSLQFLNDNTIAYLARNQVMLYDIPTSKVTQNLNIRS